MSIRHTIANRKASFVKADLSLVAHENPFGIDNWDIEFHGKLILFALFRAAAAYQMCHFVVQVLAVCTAILQSKEEEINIQRGRY